MIHKCCNFLNIKSHAKLHKYKHTGEKNKTYDNIVRGQWNAKRPLEIVVYDMTRIRQGNIMYEWTYILDTFNNEIISHHISKIEGDKTPYYQCLEDLKLKVKKQKDPVILHTDQGSVYSSRAFSESHKDYNIVRSMSRVATPTDNPIIESINGWIKSELRSDYTKEEKRDFPNFLNKYVEYFNNERLAYALGYLSPFQYKLKNGFR
ncbi:MULTISPECIES: DDE-type integrase/transposase/recombinase [Clostridium]|uniref:DDE-type integrase/transposase/recombinase n=1 Tax=Clostridium TaxID=1485 RepID=UPI0009C15E0B|nr:MULTISPECIES: DDE-type integrase/transposase/recombinase [Clostridium]PJI10254.1 integrase [Clostridium sp. CT7]